MPATGKGSRRMRRIGHVAAGAGMIAAVAGFYLPWVRLEVREPDALRPVQGTRALHGLAGDLGRVAVTVRRGTETITSTLPTLAALPPSLSGAEIPRLVRQPDARAAILLLETLTQTRWRLELKSLLVYLLPGCALLAGCGLLIAGHRRPVASAIGLGSAALAAVIGWQMLAAIPASPLLIVTPSIGLWVSLGAYAVLALAGGLHAAAGRGRLH